MPSKPGVCDANDTDRLYNLVSFEAVLMLWQWSLLLFLDLSCVGIASVVRTVAFESKEGSEETLCWEHSSST